MSNVRGRLAQHTNALKAEQAALRQAVGNGKVARTEGAAESIAPPRRVEDYLQEDASERQERLQQLQRESELRERSDAPHHPEIDQRSRAIAASSRGRGPVEDRLLAAGQASQASLDAKRVQAQLQGSDDPDASQGRRGGELGGKPDGSDYILRSGHAASEGRSHVDETNRRVVSQRKHEEFVERSKQWQERREQSLRRTQQEVEAQRVAELRSAPRIDRTSDEIARRQQQAASAAGGAPVTASDRLYAEAQLRKEASEHRADRIHREQVPGNPAITRKAAQLRREGDVGDRLYNQAMESNRQRKLVQAHELRKLEEDAMGGGLEQSMARLGRGTGEGGSGGAGGVDSLSRGGFLSPASSTARSGRRRRGSIEAGRDLYMKGFESQKRIELQRQMEEEEYRENARPRLNRKSLEIAESSGVVHDRLHRPTASYAIKRHAARMSGTPVRGGKGHPRRLVGFGSSTPRQVQLASPGSAAMVIARDEVGRMLPATAVATNSTVDASLRAHLADMTKRGELDGSGKQPPLADLEATAHSTTPGASGVGAGSGSAAPESKSPDGSMAGSQAQAQEEEEGKKDDPAAAAPAGDNAAVPSRNPPHSGSESSPGAEASSLASASASGGLHQPSGRSPASRATGGMSIGDLGRSALSAAAIIREEEKELTFRPKVKKHSREIAKKRAVAGVTVEERLSEAARRRARDIDRLKQEREEQLLKECTFQPNKGRRRQRKGRSASTAADAAPARKPGEGAAAFRAVLEGQTEGVGAGGSSMRSSLLRSSRRQADAESASRTPTSMYAKAVEWKRARERRLQMMRDEKQDVDLVGCTFQPNRARGEGVQQAGRGGRGDGGPPSSSSSGLGAGSKPRRGRRASFAGGESSRGRLPGSRMDGRARRRRASIAGTGHSELDLAAAADGEGVDILTLTRPGVEDFFRRKARAHAIEEEKAAKAARHATGRGWTGRPTVAKGFQLGRKRGPGVAALRRPVDYDPMAAGTYARGAIAKERARREAAVRGMPIYEAPQSPVRGSFEAASEHDGGFLHQVRTDKERRHEESQRVRRQEEDKKFQQTVERLAEEALARHSGRGGGERVDGASAPEAGQHAGRLDADELVKQARKIEQQDRENQRSLQSAADSSDLGDGTGSGYGDLTEEDMRVNLQLERGGEPPESSGRKVNIAVAARAALGASLRKQAAASRGAQAADDAGGSRPEPQRDEEVVRVLRSARNAMPPDASDLMRDAVVGSSGVSRAYSNAPSSASAPGRDDEAQLASDRLREAVVRASQRSEPRESNGNQGGITAAQILSMSAQDRRLLGPEGGAGSDDELLERMERAAQASLAATQMQVQEHLRRMKAEKQS